MSFSPSLSQAVTLQPSGTYSRMMKFEEDSMRNIATWIVVLSVSGTCSTLTAQALKLPEGPGKATTQKVCGGCHGAEIVIGRQETQEGWGQIVSEMVDRGAIGTED